MIAAVTYTHSFEQASEYARAALEMLARQQAPANPENFAVWYTYFSGADQDLKRAVDGLLGENEAVGEKGTVELYNRFIVGEQDDAAREAAHQIEEQLAAVYTVLEEAGDGAAEYGKTLETVSGQIARGEGVGEVREVIATLLAQTRDMAERTRTLENRLEESTARIKSLSTDLETVRQEAITDGLTGIANRKHFDAVFTAAADEAQETGEDLCLLVLDIDHFKKFNDTYGHQVGDQVLKLLAMTLTESIKGRDTAARYGGRGVCRRAAGNDPRQRRHRRRQHSRTRRQKSGRQPQDGQEPGIDQRLHRRRTLCAGRIPGRNRRPRRSSPLRRQEMRAQSGRSRSRLFRGADRGGEVITSVRFRPQVSGSARPRQGHRPG